MDFSDPIRDWHSSEFDQQFQDQIKSSELLYSGAVITTFQAISMLTSWFALHPGISKAAFDRLLCLFHKHILPDGNTLPKGYRDAQKILQNCITPTNEYHCCVNDCVVFRDSESEKYAQLQQCPKCKEPCYKIGSKGIPRKRFIHIPLEPRLRRMFSQKETARLFQKRSQQPNDNDMQFISLSTIHESSAWKEWYKNDGIFDGDERAVALGICADGVNPFAKEKNSYSMWPIVLFPLNFPAKIRKSSSSMLLAGIIPGPKEARYIDPYMEIVAGDVASVNGVEMLRCTH